MGQFGSIRGRQSHLMPALGVNRDAFVPGETTALTLGRAGQGSHAEVKTVNGNKTIGSGVSAIRKGNRYL